LTRFVIFGPFQVQTSFVKIAVNT